MKSIRLYLSYFFRYPLSSPGLFLLTLMLLLVGTMLQIPVPLLMKKIIDDVIPAKNLLLLAKLGAVISVIIVLRELTNYFQRVNYQRLKNKIYSKIVEELLGYYFNLSYEEIKRKDPGYFYSRIFEEPRELEESLTETASYTFKLFLIFVFGLTACFKLSVVLTLFVLFSAPFLQFINAYFNRKITAVTGEFQESQAEFREYSIELIRSYKIVNLYGLFSQALQEMNTRISSVLKMRSNKAKLVSTYSFFYTIFSDSIPFFVFIFGIVEVIRGQISIGGLVAFLELVRYITVPVESFSQIQVEISEAIAHIRRFEEIKSKPDLGKGKRVDEVRKISLLDVCVEFDDFKLGPVNCEFEKGKKYILTGENGSGKSTLVEVITGFLRHSGRVIINDHLSIEEVDKKGYFSRFAASFFPPILLPCLESNLKNIKDERVMSFVEKEVLKGRRGLKVSQLSAGERQKLNVALALSQKDVDFYILDEPFSNVDNSSKIALLSYIKDLPENKGVIIITPDIDGLANQLEDFETIKLKGGVLSCTP
ncbi:MAG: ABC transporter ATP-binding protein [candidate division WOR-3 bacterium]